jgi:hypothetical protein
MSEAESARLMERIFGWFLDGHPVLTKPLDLALLSDDPERALGYAATWSLSETPRGARTSP